MPRGLGDDPLSKRRKTGSGKKRKSLVSQTTPSDPVVAVPFSTPSVQSSSEAVPPVGLQPSPSPTVSYNDVFFQRRSEAGDAETPETVVPTALPSVAEPAVQSIESVQDPDPVVVAETSVPNVASPKPEGEEHAEVPSDPFGTSAEPVEKAEPVQPRPDDRGFFKRIFGRLRQH